MKIKISQVIEQLRRSIISIDMLGTNPSSSWGEGYKDGLNAAKKFYEMDIKVLETMEKIHASEENDFRKRFEDLKKDLREKINSYSCSFDTIKCDYFDKIFFEHNDGFEKEMCIKEIVAEGSNVGVYPLSENYVPHSENTIENVHDLFFILNTIEDYLNIE